MPDLTPEDLDRMRAQAVSPSHGAWTEDAVDRLIVLVAAEYEKRIAELEQITCQCVRNNERMNAAVARAGAAEKRVEELEDSLQISRSLRLKCRERLVASIKRRRKLEEALRELVTLKDGDDGWPPHGRCNCDHCEYCETCFPPEYRAGGKYAARHHRWPAAWAAARSLLAQGGEQKESTHGKV